MALDVNRDPAAAPEPAHFGDESVQRREYCFLLVPSCLRLVKITVCSIPITAISRKSLFGCRSR